MPGSLCAAWQTEKGGCANVAYKHGILPLLKLLGCWVSLVSEWLARLVGEDEVEFNTLCWCACLMAALLDATVKQGYGIALFKHVSHIATIVQSNKVWTRIHPRSDLVFTSLLKR
jgi:hypothetical protein